MNPGIAWLPALVGLAAGAVAGWGSRLLLARLRRGVVVRAGILEVACALITAVGVGLSWPGPVVALVVWAGVLGWRSAPLTWCIIGCRTR